MADRNSNSIQIRPSVGKGQTVSASEVKAALGKAAHYYPELASLLLAARDIIIRLETEKREALIWFDRPEAKEYLRREAAVTVTSPGNGA